MRSESDDATPSLYQWAGGEAAIRRLIDCFYDRVERDELLSPFFPGGVGEDARAHVTAWWSEVLGGPGHYSEEVGGYESMVAHHRGLAITPEQRFRFASLLSLAATTPSNPQIPSFARRSSPTSSGGLDSRCTTPSPEPRSPSTRPCRAGLGTRPRSSPRRSSRSCGRAPARSSSRRALRTAPSAPDRSPLTPAPPRQAAVSA